LKNIGYNEETTKAQKTTQLLELGVKADVAGTLWAEVLGVLILASVNTCYQNEGGHSDAGTTPEK